MRRAMLWRERRIVRFRSGCGLYRPRLFDLWARVGSSGR